MNLPTKQKQTHRQRDRLAAHGKGSGGGLGWEFGVSI